MTMMFNFTRKATPQEARDYMNVNKKLDAMGLYEEACFTVGSYAAEMLLNNPDKNVVKAMEDFAALVDMSVKALVNWCMVYPV